MQVKALEMSLIGPKCFDFGFYKAHNADLPALFPAPALWEHFISDGQFEVLTRTLTVYLSSLEPSLHGLAQVYETRDIDCLSPTPSRKPVC